MTSSGFKSCLAIAWIQLTIQPSRFSEYISIILWIFASAFRQDVLFRAKSQELVWSHISERGFRVLDCRKSFRRRILNEWQWRAQLFIARDKQHVVQSIHDRSFKMAHHLKIVAILHVVALKQTDLPINHTDFCMKCAENWAVIVYDFHVYVRYLFGCR